MVQAAFCRLISLFLAVVCSLAIVRGQGVTTATVVGKVAGTGGSPLTGATVVAKHAPSGTTYGAFSREDGRFTMPGLRVGGPYTITVNFEGYKAQTVENIFLSLGQVFDLPVTLAETSSTTETVLINAEGSAILNGTRTGAATNIGQSQLRALPTISRSLTDFTRLTPQSNGNNFGGRNNLYNNVMIDGSSFNNSFGLASNIGGQTNSQPISLDAIEEIQVSLAPYDVRQSGFTGAGINAVTRSGDNKFRGSLFSFGRNESFIGKKVDTFSLTNNAFSQYQYGFRLGGPIVKDKVFFFVNAEFERRSDPATTIIAFRDSASTDPANPGVSNVKASDLAALAGFLKDTYGYDPGAFENYDFRTQSNKILAKIDWNINQNHKFSIRYNYFTSIRDIPVSNSGSAGNNRQASKNTLPFQNASYIQNNNMNSVVAELNSVINSKLSNNAILGLTMLRDFRESGGDVFPLVDILNGGNTMTSFGYEPFTPNNRLNTDNIQFTDNLTYYAAKNHTVTAGLNVEHYRFANGFTPRYYGDFRFNSLADFYNAAPIGTPTPIGPSTGLGLPARYELTYDGNAEGVSTLVVKTGDYTDTVPVAKVNATQIGLYAQDEWNVTNRLKLTIGVRADMVSYPIDLPKNDSLAKLSFYNGQSVDPSVLPNAKTLWSPRVGFNWDVKGDKSLQVRGGTGIFTGRIPFVWLSNQASNNGVLFGSVIATGSQTSSYPFSTDPRAYSNQSGLPSTVLINSTSANFRFPQVWRSNLAADYKLPAGIIAGIEGIYTKDVNAVYHRDMNFMEAQGHAVAVGTGTDTRERFPASYNGGSVAFNRRNQYVTNAIELANTNQGYSYFVTGSLTKEPVKTEFGTLFGSIAYTYGRTKDLTSSPSAIAATAWNSNQVPSSPNVPVLSWSSYDLTSRFFASLSYEKEIANVLTITGSLFYNVQRAGTLQSGAAQVTAPDTRFSYVYSGDMNGDGIASNDLVYVPRDQTEILLLDLYKTSTGTITTTAAGNTLFYTKEDQWKDLNGYIEQDDYLSQHRGKVMERNGALMPWRSTVDLRLMVDPHMKVGGDKHGFQVTLDILNLGNLINPKWGVLQTPNRTSLVNFENYNATGQPQFSFRKQANEAVLSETFVKNTGIVSRWQMQIGIRYLFN